MTDEQLKAIRERRQSARRWQLRQDIAALLAEVERLRAIEHDYALVRSGMVEFREMTP